MKPNRVNNTRQSDSTKAIPYVCSIFRQSGDISRVISFVSRGLNEDAWLKLRPAKHDSCCDSFVPSQDRLCVGYRQECSVDLMPYSPIGPGLVFKQS